VYADARVLSQNFAKMALQTGHKWIA
jgi:hypothetical protein